MAGVSFLHLGLMPYGECLKLMDKLHSEVVCGQGRPVFLVVQHNPVVTMGNRKLSQDLRFELPDTARKYEAESPQPFGAFEYFEIDRGGSATAHEPGQLVVYPILPIALFSEGVRGLVGFLEEAVISTCAHFGVLASRDALHPGVWCGTSKIAAVGLRVKQHITRHGLAFNVSNSMETFRAIVPCGIAQRSVTSLQQELQSLDKEQNRSLDFGSVELFQAVQEQFLSDLRKLFGSYTTGAEIVPSMAMNLAKEAN